MVSRSGFVFERYVMLRINIYIILFCIKYENRIDISEKALPKCLQYICHMNKVLNIFQNSIEKSV